MVLKIDGPLTVLGNKLTVGPPSLRQVIGWLDQGESIQEFMHLVRDFLPEHEQEILGHRNYDRMEAFCRLFEQKYFPLHDMMLDEQEYAGLVFGIPIIRHGLSYDEWHEFEAYPPGHQLLLALVKYPYFGESGQAARVPLLEQCAEHVGKDLVKRIDAEGWDRETLHRLLDGTRFEAAALFADWVCQQTGTAFLDWNWGEEWGEEIPWSRENVEALTREHARARQIGEQMGSLLVWIEKAPRQNFKQLLDAIIEGLAKTPEKPKTLIEVFGFKEDEGE